MLNTRPLTDRQHQMIAELCKEIGVVSLASVAIPFFLDNSSPTLALSGVAITIFFWYLAIQMTR